MPKKTMDGTEQTMFESTELGEFNGYIFLDTLQAGDTVVLRAYVKDGEADTYKLRDSKSYTGAQSIPCIEVRPIISSVGFKITAQQTAGTYRVLNHNWFKR